VLLDRPGNEFATARHDEIGTLSRMLDAMVTRLRASATALRDAERRATVGDMARQVNHDIRNGLLPIRNVVRHLADVAQAEPAALAGVFAERQDTLAGGISYLESLAGSYARLTPATERQPCDVNAVVRDVVRDAAGNSNALVQLDLDDAAPRVLADPVALRRVLENLAVNAVQSLDDGPGDVVARTRAIGERDERGVRREQGQLGEHSVVITIADTGHGIAADALDRIFDDFYTTKAAGTGLGLSIVRRLVGDMGGRIRVESEPGRGTSFHIELPAAP
jgi:signal transduction histidine kinase